MFKWSVVLLIVFCVPLSLASETRFIPSEAEYHRFLVNGWDAQRPNLLVFKDPFCPYCIKAIPKLDDLHDYNVFVFWAPILGQNSVARVDDILRCSRPASKQVFDAVVSRAAPDCDNQHNQKTITLNNYVVDNYNISAVPSYFFQGQRVSLSYLVRSQYVHPPVNGVVIDWKRYAMMKAYNRQVTKTIALIVPESHAHKVRDLAQEYKPEYLFLEKDLIDQHADLLNCESSDKTCIEKKTSQYQSRVAEFKLILEGSLPQQGVVSINTDGIIQTL